MRCASRVTLLVVALVIGGTLGATTLAQGRPAGGSGACVLPRLIGSPANVVKRILPLLGCRLGTVTRTPSISTGPGNLVATRPPAGSYRHNKRIDLVVSSGLAAGPQSAFISGGGTNDDPYTAPCGDKVDGSCRVTFQEFSLPNFLNFMIIPAYRCPDNNPWLLKKPLSEGRIVPPGVLVEPIKGTVGTTIIGVSAKEGKTERKGTKTYAFDYATGTRTGFPNTAHAWSDDVKFRISLYCTDDLTKANLVNVRG